ncbi:MAG TPA: protein BatD, partial [Paludibacteraceae bacterium]|nr:protein BatD [Paludibacteraceae bacterium]
STLFWLAYIIPTFLFVLIIVLLHKQLKENADSSLMKIKRANKVAKKRFLLAHNFLKQKNEKSFYDEIMKALWGYLSDKLAITNSDLFKDNLVSELQARGVASTYIDETIAVLNDCEFARFSPSSSSELAMETMYQRACNIITSLESELKHKE